MFATCPTSTCTTATQTSTFTDDAGSHGAGGNNTYVTDLQARALGYDTIIGHAYNVATTTSGLVVTITGMSDSYNFYTSVAIDVSGLSVSPTLHSTGHVQQSSGASITAITSGSCSVGDFAWTYAATGGAGTPVLPGGWTAIGITANNQIAGWQTVAGSGTLSAAFTGLDSTSAAGIACYAP